MSWPRFWTRSARSAPPPWATTTPARPRCFAATRPERTSALVLAHTSARYAADDYPIGLPASVIEALLAEIDHLWGTEATAAMMVPSRADDARFRRWYAKLQRTSASPESSRCCCGPP
jgi:hypothetical protein